MASSFCLAAVMIYVLMCTMNSTMYDCIQMENSAWVRLIYQPKFDTHRLIHRSGNAATRIDIIKSTGFNARIQLDGLNMYKTDTSYKGKHIGTAFGVRKGFRKKCTFICEASNRLTKNECWLRQEVHTTLEIVQTLMQRVALLGSHAFVTKKHRPTNFLKLEFDKIAQKNIRFSRNRC